MIDENNELSKGIFWIVCGFVETDSEISVDLSDYKLLYFTMPCDETGLVEYSNAKHSNSKKGDSFNHKLTWESGLFHNPEFVKLSRKYPYNYYPRGRVEISNRKAIIYINTNINTDMVIDNIKNKFGLCSKLKSVKTIEDNSYHYHCYADGINE